MLHRPRRTRKNAIVREMTAETRLSRDMFMYPYFVTHGKDIRRPIAAMPGINHFSVDELLKDAERGLKLGLNKVLLFGVGEEKSDDGHTAHSGSSVVPQAVKALKERFKEDIYVVTDVCVCAYTSHGHCGILEDGYVQNDASVELLSKMALSHAEAGADMVAPSDMMDGRIAGIRDTLDAHGFSNTGIMSYAVKFASAYYGPFREAADSAPQQGDRKSYQMDFRNGREALKEALMDEEEGADIIMVKPALAYLDIISAVRDNTLLPVACYNVSGEYSMVKAAAAQGLVDEQKIVMENMYAFARAGSNIVITYHAMDILENGWL
ncbi:MAG: delta-aminolevulinic acid dehydratase [Bacteroidetes bacterium]|nr:MAG: delta-aminolevulinic acid dehydratase [Bacteroidota bacterium]